MINNKIDDNMIYTHTHIQFIYLPSSVFSLHSYLARTHVRLESTMPLTYHDWITITAYRVAPSTQLYTITVGES